MFFAICYRKTLKHFYTITITNNICPRNSFLNFFNHKNFFSPIKNVNFSKKGFKFTNFKLMMTLLFYSLNSIYVLDFTSRGLIVIVLRFVLFCSLTMLVNFSIYIFLIRKSSICKFCSLWF